MRLAPPPIPPITELPGALARRLGTAVSGSRPETSRRVIRSRPGRAYLPVRGVHRPEREEAARGVERALARIKGVHWAQVNPILAEVAVAFDDGAVGTEDLARVLDSVEDAHELRDEGFPPDAPLHPLDATPMHRGAVALVADATGVGIGVVGRLLHVPRLPVELASAIPAIDSLAPVRRALEARPVTESAVALLNAVLQGLGQGPLGLVIDAGHRATVLAELDARRRAWLEAEPRLHPGPIPQPLRPVEVQERPRPLPPGLLASYGQASSLASLVGSGVTLAATRDVRRTADILLAGAPRAALLGVEGFAAQVDRALAGSEVICMDPRVLRRLDRLDTVLIDAPALITGRRVIAEIVPVGAGRKDPAGIEASARALFDPDNPTGPTRRDGWTLASADTFEGVWPRGARAREHELSGSGLTTLGLSKNGALVALVSLQPQLRPAATELVAAVRDAGHLLAVAGARTGLGPVVRADRVMAGGEHLTRSLRTLQAEGRVVALIAARPSAALQAADCGIGVVADRDAHPPWGAHALCLHLIGAATVIDATRLARTATARGVGLAAAGSLGAGLLAFSPLPGAGRRAVTALQLSALAALATGTWTGAQLARRHGEGVPEALAWHSLEATDVLRRLGSRPEGLTAGDAAARVEPVAQKAPKRFPSVIATELFNPLTAILGAGAALSAAVGSLVDAAMIVGVIGVDAAVDVAQRTHTEAIVRRLTAAVSNGSARVLRDGVDVAADARSLVVGDVIRLGAGDAIPADCRLVEASGLEVDESSLTGESLPVPKTPEPVAERALVADRRCMVYAGTAVAAGHGTAVVVATGAGTEARRAISAAAPPPTGVETRLRRLTATTVPVVLAAGSGLALNGLLRGRPPTEAVGSGVSLAAAAVPEGLPFVATVAQTSTARRLARRGVLVRNPKVLEALGRVDVLCFDKTGTLTEGRLQLRQVSDGHAEEAVTHMEPARRLVLAAALRATPRPRGRRLPHPTDQAIVDGAATAAVVPTEGAPGWHKIASLPFEPGRAYHAVLGRAADGWLLAAKGAPEVVIPRCTAVRRATGERVGLDRDMLVEVGEEVERLARQGLRVLAVGQRSASGRQDLDDQRVSGLELYGLVGVADAARESAAAPLRELQQAGINVVMVTGDHPSTAEAVAAELDLLNGRRVLSGTDLDELDDDELDRIIGEVAVFARVTPADKVRIVTAFQRCGRVVAMTGDGANDAQGIRLAEVGVAFGSGATPAAREASDLVVTPDDLGLLIDTLAEGRAMWASVRDALAILLGGNLGEVLFTAGAALLSGQSPLTPRQLLLVNLFTDLAPAMAIAAQPPSGRINLAREGPETSLSGQLMRDIAIRAGATATSAQGAWFAARLTGTSTRARTVALVALVGAQLGQTLVIGRRSPLVIGAAVLSAAGLAAIVQTPGPSQFFDCRPLGPLGWTISVGAAGFGTAASVVAGRLLR